MVTLQLDPTPKIQVHVRWGWAAGHPNDSSGKWNKILACPPHPPDSQPQQPLQTHFTQIFCWWLADHWPLLVRARQFRLPTDTLAAGSAIAVHGKRMLNRISSTHLVRSSLRLPPSCWFSEVCTDYRTTSTVDENNMDGGGKISRAGDKDSSPPSPQTLQEPKEPDDCCESGCEPCVWEIYFDEMKAYRSQQEAQSQDKNAGGSGTT